ncbi:MAG: LysR family transcriptional regulator, partial [Silanimonas sp.]
MAPEGRRFAHPIHRLHSDKSMLERISFALEATMARRYEHLLDLEALQTTAETGSFTAAARRLGLTPSAVSRAVQRLEVRLGVALLRRSTRQLALTEAGALYARQSRAAFDLIDEAESGLRGDHQRVAGAVRLSVPTTWGHHRAPQRLASFRARYPEVRVELDMSNRNVDLLAEGFDAVVRLGEPADSAGLIARPLEHAALVLVAAPSYLTRRGAPEDVDALDAHDSIPFVLPSTGRVIPWRLRVDGVDVEWSP